MRSFKTTTLTALLAFALLPLQEVMAQDGESLFKQNCTACHTVGGGKIVGPDLQGVTEKREQDWLISFIKSSQDMIKSGDEAAKKIYEEFNQTTMPDQNLADAEIKSILDYIASQGGGGAAEDGAIEDKSAETASKKETAAPAPQTEEVTEKQIQADPDIGAKLFSGRQPLVNGGPACISCHHVISDKVIAGGKLAKELTQVYDRMGKAGIKGMVQNPAFPAMKDSYKNNKVTKEEAAHLAAFFKEVSEERIYQHASNGNQYFLWGGVIGFLILMGIFGLTWIKRAKNPVNKKIYDRQPRT